MRERLPNTSRKGAGRAVGGCPPRTLPRLDSRRTKHPAWQCRVWRNAELDGMQWKSRRQIDIFRATERREGIADLMRYEILDDHGGVYVDADTDLLTTPR
jgi:mannosyltransferase OCH1-like enzyme